MKLAITGLATAFLLGLGAGAPAYAAKAECKCDHQCAERCKKGDGKDCKCKACDCAKTGKCPHGKCHQEEATK